MPPLARFFNCATSSLITYDEVAALCAKAAGADVAIKHYDPKAFELPKGFFPFRDTPFFVSVDKAAELLGFAPKHVITEDIGWYFSDNFKGATEPDFSADEAVLEALSAKA